MQKFNLRDWLSGCVTEGKSNGNYREIKGESMQNTPKHNPSLPFPDLFITTFIIFILWECHETDISTKVDFRFQSLK